MAGAADAAPHSFDTDPLVPLPGLVPVTTGGAADSKDVGDVALGIGGGAGAGISPAGDGASAVSSQGPSRGTTSGLGRRTLHDGSSRAVVSELPASTLGGGEDEGVFTVVNPMRAATPSGTPPIRTSPLAQACHACVPVSSGLSRALARAHGMGLSELCRPCCLHYYIVHT
jgi:hypothetical protein